MEISWTLSKTISSIIIVISINQIIRCSALYIPLFSPPQEGAQSGELLNTKKEINEGLECEPLVRDKPPAIGLELSRSTRKLPPCPPPNSPPVLDKIQLKNVTVMSGENMTFDLPYSGYPEPLIEFYKSDKKVYETDRIKPFKKLVIANASRAVDQGIYTMIASNSQGVDNVNFAIDVLDRPSPPVGPLGTSLVTQNTVTLNWSPPEEPGGKNLSMSYIVERLDNNTWVHVINTTKTSKTIGNLNPGESYTFRVKAVNMYGISEPLVMNGSVVARNVPSMAQQLRVVDDRGGVKLEWMAPKRDNGDRVTAYLVEQKEAPNGQWNLIALNNGELNATVDGLTPGKVYQFRVSAINHVGKGDPSKPSKPILITPKATSKASIDKTSLKNTTQEAIIGNPIRLEAIITGEPKPEFQWKLNGKPVKEMTNKISITSEGNKTILIIDSFSGKQAGNYTLSVRNSVGADEVSFIIKASNTTTPTSGSNTQQTPTLDKSNLKSNENMNGLSNPTTSTPFLVNEDETYLNSIAFSAPKPNLNSGPFPSAPVGPIEALKTTNESILFKWSLPKDVGGSELDLFRVEVFKPETNGWVTVSKSSSPATIVTGLKSDTNYRFRVIAVNANGDSAPLEATLTTLSNSCPPPLDGCIDLVKVTTNSIHIKWDELKNRNNDSPLVYKVEKLNSNKNEWESVANTTKNNLTIRGLSCLSPNKFRVKPSNSLCDASALESKIFTTQSGRPQPPSPPLQASNIQVNQLKISWNPPKDDCGSPVIEYIVEKQELNPNNAQNVNPWVTTNRVKTLETTITGLKPNTNYSFAVIAVNSKGESLPLEANLTTRPDSCPQPLECCIDLVKVTSNSIEIKWDQTQLNRGLQLIYKVEKLNSLSNEWQSVANTTNNNVVISGLKCFTPNKFRVKVSNTQCDSSPLVSKVFTTNGSSPEPPSIQVYNIGTDEVTISWTQPQESCGCSVKEYIVEKQNFNSNDWETLGRTLQIRNRIKNLDSQKTYRFRVKAVNCFGESNPSTSDWIITNASTTTMSTTTTSTTTTSTTTTTTTPLTTPSTTTTTTTPSTTSSTTTTTTTPLTTPSTTTTTTTPSTTSSTTTTTTTPSTTPSTTTTTTPSTTSSTTTITTTPSTTPSTTTTTTTSSTTLSTLTTTTTPSTTTSTTTTTTTTSKTTTCEPTTTPKCWAPKSDCNKQKVIQEPQNRGWDDVHLKIMDDDSDDFKTLAMLDRLRKDRDDDFD